MITWEQRRGQIKHLLYELCLTGRIDKATFCEQLHDLNNVAPIVRCKDCKWYTPFRNIQGGEMGEGECEGYDPCVPANHFCSRGERKDGGENVHNGIVGAYQDASTLVDMGVVWNRSADSTRWQTAKSILHWSLKMRCGDEHIRRVRTRTN